VITEKTLPLAQEAGISMIRFPGGNWGDENNLQSYHIDQFVSLAEQIGAEVSVNVRLLNGSAELAAELVRYANLEKEVINCISDDEPCNKWRILVKDVNNNLKEKYKINFF